MKIISVFILVFLTIFLQNIFSQDYAVPVRANDNLVIASYNIKFFGNTHHDFKKLAEVIQNFDICGILEVKQEKQIPLLVDELKNLTNLDWGYTYGVRTHRPGSSYYEAYAVLWRKDRVELGDGVISNVWDLEENYRNDPYIVSFKKNNFDFIFFIIHTRWGNDEEGTRENEVTSLIDQINFIYSFTNERDIILAGDFNYTGTNEAMELMADELDFTQIDPNAKSTFKTDGSGYASSYDHIFISSTNTVEFIQGQSAVLDATKLVFGNNQPANMLKSKDELSDHLPVWAIFQTTQQDDD